MSPKEAEDRLYACLADRRWASEVASGRPFPDAQTFFATAWIALNGLTDEDWLAAFKSHPRIGKTGGEAPETSAREQGRAMQSPAPTLAALMSAGGLTAHTEHDDDLGATVVVGNG